MPDFEQSLKETVDVYVAGVQAMPMPRFKLIRKSDARKIYTAGYTRGLDELAKIDIEPAFFVAQ